jgi:hypothetical protein
MRRSTVQSPHFQLVFPDVCNEVLTTHYLLELCYVACIVSILCHMMIIISDAYTRNVLQEHS